MPRARSVTSLLRFVGYGTLGVLVTLLVIYGVFLHRLPPLSIWPTGL